MPIYIYMYVEITFLRFTDITITLWNYFNERDCVMRIVHKTGLPVVNFGYVKLYKQGKNILKVELFHIFRWIFSIFSGKKNHHSNIRINLIDVKKKLMLELTPGECQ